MDEDRYDIIRFYKEGDERLMRAGVTLAEAREWCRRPDTAGQGWFDGYDKAR